MAQLNLVAIRAHDPERLAHFYSALGFDFRSEKHGNGSKHFSGEGGGFILEIYPISAGAAATTGTRLGFATARLEETVAALVSRNASVIAGPHESLWGMRAVLQDPEGHRIELIQNSAA